MYRRRWNRPRSRPSRNAEGLKAISGIYASSYGLHRLEARADHTMTLANYIDDQWLPALEGLKLRSDGYLVADSNPVRAYRGCVAAGCRYLAARFPCGMGHYDMELPVGHELPLLLHCRPGGGRASADAG